MEYQGERYNELLTTWETETFIATLRIDGIERGQSAAHFRMKNCITAQYYTMFMKDLLELLKAETLVKGQKRGQWGWKKRGMNFGIYYIGSTE